MKNTDTPRRGGNLDFIQAMRGIAAVMVVLCHSSDLFHGTPWEGFARRLFWPGAFGVDLFFIISGFIIMYTSYSYTSKDVGTFIKKRVFRIVPPYLSATLIYVTITGANGWVPNFIRSMLFIPLNTDSPIYFGAATLNVGWTLNYEAYFYAIFAIGLLFGRFKFYFWSLWFAITLIITPYFLSIIWWDKPVIPGYGYLNLMMQKLIFEFIFGAICAIFIKESTFTIRNKSTAFILCVTALSFPVIGYISQFRADHGPTNFGLYYIIMFGLLIVCFEYVRDFIRIPKVLSYLGDISYSMYLIHPVAIIISNYIVTFLIGSSRGWSGFCSAVVLSIVFSSGFNMLIEVKMCNYLQRRFVKKSGNASNQ